MNHNAAALAPLPPTILNDLDAALAERRLYDFVRVSWPVLHPASPFVGGWHVEAICDHLEAVKAGEIKHLLIFVAPRMTKSMVASVCFPAWCWINTPSSRWIFTGYNEDLSTEHSVHCRRLVESTWYRQYWGDRYYLTSDQNQKTLFENSQHGARSAYGMSGVTGHGGDYNICDDPHDRVDWMNSTKLKATVGKYDAEIYPSVNDPKNSRRVVVMQRLSELDLGGHLKKQGNWVELCLPTEYDPVRSCVTVLGWKDPRKAAGDLLCPERTGAAEVVIEKRRGHRLFAAQHQQNPSVDTAKIFKRNNWRFYTDSPKQIAATCTQVIQSWDMAFKDLEESSLVAGHIWGIRDADMFLLDRIGDHLDFNATKAAVERMTAKWPEARAKVVEGKANGPAIINNLNRQVAGLIEWPLKGQRMDSKQARAAALQPSHEAGNLWLPSPVSYPWVEEFIDYFADFPGSEYDDDVDAASQAFDYFEKQLLSWGPL